MDNVLDASAILALLLKETGHEEVTIALAAGAIACTVNAAEVVSYLVRNEVPKAVAWASVEGLPITWVDSDLALARIAGEMIAVTKRKGLSLGDRFCLALASRQGVLAVTADGAWAEVAADLGVTVRLIR